MCKKQICLFQEDFIINCYENENDNENIDHIKNIDLDVDIETNIQNIACHGKTMSY